MKTVLGRKSLRDVSSYDGIENSSRLSVKGRVQVIAPILCVQKRKGQGAELWTVDTTAEEGVNSARKMRCLPGTRLE